MARRSIITAVARVAVARARRRCCCSHRCGHQRCRDLQRRRQAAADATIAVVNDTANALGAVATAAAMRARSWRLAA